MNKVLSLVLLVAGLVCLGFGFAAADSLGADLSRFFTGAPTDKAIWLLVVGTVAVLAGAGGLIRSSRRV